MYNDFSLISETEMLKLKNAYNEKLSKVNSLSLENGFLDKLENICKNFKGCFHYLSNLKNSSKNLEDKNLYKKVEEELSSIFENLKNLYEVNEENLNLNIDFINENNFTNNFKGLFFHLLNILEDLFVVIIYENNVKIKLPLNSNYLSLLEQFKNINSSLCAVNKVKIFSLFKRY